MAGHSDNDLGLPTFSDPVKVAIVIAPYYTKISNAQLASARGVLDRAGVQHETIEVPGSLEIPAAVALAHLRRQRPRDRHVTEPLMWTELVIIDNPFLQKMSKVLFAEHHEMIQDFVFCSLYPDFSEGIHVWRSGRDGAEF